MAVENRDEAVPDAVPPNQAKEAEENANEEEMSEDPMEAGESGEGTAEERAVAPTGDDAAAAAGSGVVTKEAGKEETAVVMAITEEGDQETGVEPVEEEPKEVMEVDEEPVEAVEEDEEAEDEDPEEAEDEEPQEAVEEPEDEDPEGAVEEPEEAEVEDGAEEDEGVEDEATDVSKEFASVDADEEPEEAQDEGKHGNSNKDKFADQLSNDEDADGNDGNFEIFVGGLPKDCVDEDIKVVFSQCGEIESIRIIRNPETKKHKGIAFVRYADTDASKKALAEFKDGIKVKGKKVRVSVAQPPRESNEKLLVEVKGVYLEHVPCSWNEKDIEECCQGYGKIQNVRLLRSKKKYYSFVEFSSRKSALACVEGINNAGISDGDVKLVASLARPPRKVQVANKSVKGGFKVNSGATSKGADKSKMKRDQVQEIVVKNKSHHKLLKADEIKHPSQGDVEVPQISTHSKGKVKVGKRKNTSIDERQLKKARKNCDESKPPSHDGAKVLQTSTHSKGKGKAEKIKNTSVNERPLKKAWTNRDENKLPTQGDVDIPQTSSRSKGKKKFRKNKTIAVNERPVNKARRNGNMKHPAGPRYTTNNQPYPGVGATFRSKPHAHDLEPHAGIIPLVNRAQRTRAHDNLRTAPYNIHQISDFPYARERAAPQPAYSVHTSNAAGYETGYAYTYHPPPPPPPSISYHPGSGPYIPRRYY
ncbi:hypothetical protein GUJ93_ZPchr0010g9456 [Zizania palustris]|uniref:RRM domain-containing protein n=1 Tax=Zizania palustris TaxID=103762 RepID=A0A8J6BR93_ZIZPA|nr:hypothetical protein GUJ93_ZPchr0010g9456 [Zizania palustris]